MDELLRGPSAWGGVYERHGRKETPAPKWEALEKDFRAHIPRADAGLAHLKGRGRLRIMNRRPISVTSAVSRLWAATRLRILMEWMLTWVPEGMQGAIPKRGADDVMYAIGLRIEHAAECGKPYVLIAVMVRAWGR
ncbi:hypothetical protein DIPPA_06671 [Diplonema papillatum]|nr:hypothetical protein DIPPA_06671 [Diplonema papillatum]